MRRAVIFTCLSISISILISGCLKPMGSSPDDVFASLPADASSPQPSPTSPPAVSTPAVSPPAQSAGISSSAQPTVSSDVHPTPSPSLAQPTPSPAQMPEPFASPETPDETVSPTPQPVDVPDNPKKPAGSYGSPYLADGKLSNKKLSWYFVRNSEHQPPEASREFDIGQFDGYYLGDISRKTIYLTFDEGYENGCTEAILDILKEKGVKAAFFVTKPYVRSNPELITRMINEGHAVANHSVTHPSLPDLSDEEVINEIIGCADYFREVTGYEMARFFRPPMGEYSARTLYLTQKEGYKTIFWSFAYQDWEVDNQPGKEAAFKNVMNNLHNGGIILLHAVSTSNTEALPDIIDAVAASGFTFGSLHDL